MQNFLQLEANKKNGLKLSDQSAEPGDRNASCFFVTQKQVDEVNH